MSSTNCRQLSIDCSHSQVQQHIGWAVIENFAWLFYLNSFSSPILHTGKSIHDTRSTVEVMIHYPIGNFNDILWTPHSVSYVSHFRESLKDIHLRNISITDLHFDYNYFVCYFIPLVRKLNFSLCQCSIIKYL